MLLWVWIAQNSWKKQKALRKSVHDLENCNLENIEDEMYDIENSKKTTAENLEW